MWRRWRRSYRVRRRSGPSKGYHGTTGRAKYPLVAPEGGKEALQAMMTNFTMGSDHEVYTDSSWKIPAIYLNDWPDRYIHTNFDTPANIDPTKLKRAGFIGAASGYFLARMKEATESADILDSVVERRFVRGATIERRAFVLSEDEDSNLRWQAIEYEGAVLFSIQRFVSDKITAGELALGRFAPLLVHRPKTELKAVGEGSLIFARNAEPKGPMSVFGYDYFEDKYGEERTKKLKLLQYQGLRGSGGEYAYEVLNFADGIRNVQQIRDAVSAEYGPVPLEYVVEYLKALEEVEVVKRVK